MFKSFRYVKLEYRPILSLDEIESQLIAETRDLENNDFVELLIYNRNEGVLMTGKMTDGKKDGVIYCILSFILFFIQKTILFSETCKRNRKILQTVVF